MGQIPASEDTNSSASQEIPRISRNPEGSSGRVVVQMVQALH